MIDAMDENQHFNAQEEQRTALKEAAQEYYVYNHNLENPKPKENDEKNDEHEGPPPHFKKPPISSSFADLTRYYTSKVPESLVETMKELQYNGGNKNDYIERIRAYMR